jgi:hypothetical protein
MIHEIFTDKTLKGKQKTELLSQLLLKRKLTTNELAGFISQAKDSEKASCIEAAEFAAAENPRIVDKKFFRLMCECLAEKAPRIKWESAKVIAHCAHLHKGDLGGAIQNLLANTSHEGTVVRWSAAKALAAISTLNTAHNKKLLPRLKKIAEKEEKNSISKIYTAALKKTEKN